MESLAVYILGILLLLVAVGLSVAAYKFDRNRIGRIGWLVRGFAFTALFCCIPIIGGLFLSLFFVSAIKRLHDFNFRGWWLFLFVGTLGSHLDILHFD